MVGSGASDFGNLGIMLTRWWNASVYTDSAKDANYRSRFSKSTEASLPGYYTAYLEDAETLAEVVATSTHSGIHRYGGGEVLSPSFIAHPPRRVQLHVPPAGRARRERVHPRARRVPHDVSGEGAPLPLRERIHLCGPSQPGRHPPRGQRAQPRGPLGPRPARWRLRAPPRQHLRARRERQRRHRTEQLGALGQQHGPGRRRGGRVVDVREPRGAAHVCRAWCRGRGHGARRPVVHRPCARGCKPCRRAGGGCVAPV